MILESLTISARAFERRTGWTAKPEGLCKGDVCVPLPDGDGHQLDAQVVAERLNMPLIHDEQHNLWCLGPEAAGRALATAEAPDLELPDFDGKLFRLRSLLGRKVLLVAWASW
ncbi:hypothetical protein BH23CHL2_BH23CHL2_35730 [soil metagenome]